MRRTAGKVSRRAPAADERRRLTWKPQSIERKMAAMVQSAAPGMRPAFLRAPLWRRLGCALSLALGIALLLHTQWTQGISPLLFRTVLLALVGVFVFGLFERWPKRPPPWLPRWVLQVVGVGVSMPATTLAVYLLSTRAGAPQFWQDPNRMDGWMMLTFLSLLLAPWTALGALVRQKEAFARHQALAFELERSELERQALDARLHLLQAQVAPHFLFNTLANIQALVDASSPRASTVLRSLIAYLRAAVPLLHEPATTIDREVRLVQAYLELMQMRMPDRLQFALAIDDSAGSLRCPPATLLTLVENAVRHGLDPSEEGGAIDIEVRRRGDRCLLRVSDSGVGLSPGGGGLGTGLTTLREGLQLMFGDDARLDVRSAVPRGVCAEVEFPARDEATA